MTLGNSLPDSHIQGTYWYNTMVTVEIPQRARGEKTEPWGWRAASNYHMVSSELDITFACCAGEVECQKRPGHSWRVGKETTTFRLFLMSPTHASVVIGVGYV